MTGGPGNGKALDCGAGIGRISKHLLQRHFQSIDLVEQNPKFLEKAKDYLKDREGSIHFICSGKETFFQSTKFIVIRFVTILA
jgi:protein N-terminal methyltransferase